MPESFVVHLGMPMLPVLHTRLTSVREVEIYGWMMLTAWAMKVLLRDVHTMDGVYITVVTMKMHRSFVQVGITINLSVLKRLLGLLYNFCTILRPLEFRRSPSVTLSGIIKRRIRRYNHDSCIRLSCIIGKLKRS